jgi:hypothetical protein
MDTSKMRRSENVIDMTNRARITPSMAVPGMGLVPVPTEGTVPTARNRAMSENGAPRPAQRGPANPDAGTPMPAVPEHMIDALLSDLPRIPKDQLRMVGPALLKAMRERHVKMAAMKRFEKK